MAKRRLFRPMVLATAIAFEAQDRLVPEGARHVGRRVARRVMRWLDDRRARVNEDAFG